MTLTKRYLLLMLFGACAAAVFISSRLKVEYFDVYTIYLNARAIALGDGQDYNWTRAPLLSVLWSPFYKVFGTAYAAGAVWQISHLAAVFFYALWLWISYRVFRLCGSRSLAFIGSFLLALNPLVIHYAPFARDDIPAAVLTAAGFFFYLRDCLKSKAKFILWSGLCFAAAMSVRHVVILPILLTLGLHEIFRCASSAGLWSARFRSLRRSFLLMGLTLILFFTTMTLIYQRVQLAEGFDAPAKVLAGIMEYYKLNLAKRESSQEVVSFILQSMTWPLFVAFVAGLVAAFRSKQPAVRLMVIWFAGFLFFYSMIATNKEARFLFTLFTPLYYFAAAGLCQWFQSLQSLFKKSAAAFLAIILMILPLQSAAQAYARLWNPFYASDYAGRLSREATALAGNEKRIYWAGPLYALHDPAPLFHPDDEYTYLYHVFGHTLMFYTDRRVDAFPRARLFNGFDPETQQSWVMALGLGTKLNDGDVLVLNPEPSAYTTRTLPAQLRPLQVSRVRLWSFKPENVNSGSDINYSSVEMPKTKLMLRRSESEIFIEGAGFPAGFYEVYFTTQEGKRVWQGVLRAGAHGLQMRLPAQSMVSEGEIIFLTYDLSKSYPQPI